MAEKRKYLRFDVLMDAICRTGDALTKIKVHDFGKEGIGIESKESFSEGEDYEIEMMIPGDNIPVICEGEIAWTKLPDSGSDGHKSGIRFKGISNDDRNRILEYIYKKWR